MPSQYDTFRSTQSKINASAAFNRTVTRARIGGTNLTAITGVSNIATPSGFTGSSNNGINSTLIAGSGPVGLAVQYASGSAIGAADEIIKLIDVGISNLNQANYDGINGKNQQREVSINASGLTITRDGRYINVTGAIVNPPLASILSSGTGGNNDENLLAGRGRALDYSYRMPTGNVDKSLELRSQ